MPSSSCFQEELICHEPATPPPDALHWTTFLHPQRCHQSWVMSPLDPHCHSGSDTFSPRSQTEHHTTLASSCSLFSQWPLMPPSHVPPTSPASSHVMHQVFSTVSHSGTCILLSYIRTGLHCPFLKEIVMLCLLVPHWPSLS